MANRKKTAGIVLALAVFIIMAAGCGRYDNLQEYYDKGGNAKETIDIIADLSDEGMKMTVDGNEIIYQYCYDSDFLEELRPYAVQEIEKNILLMKSSFAKIAKNIEEQTNLKGIQIKLIYSEKSGKVLYEGWFDSSDI